MIMNLTAARPSISKTITGTRVRSGTVYATIIILAMIAFETFNYSTTAFSLQDLLGNLKFAGIPWSIFLALAFCGIDFAGIARLISPDSRKTDLKESWYLFGAWLIAATANAALTWWGVAVAINGHVLQSANIVSTTTLTRVVPVFVAILVWVIRILIIASLSSALERFSSRKPTANHTLDSEFYGFEKASTTKAANNRPAGPITMTRISNSSPTGRTSSSFAHTNANKNASANEYAESESRFL
jgi:hypothetical protein